MDIMSNIAKLKFKDCDTRKQVGLERKNYMVTVPAVLSEPQILVPMEWANGVDSVGLLNLLVMSHFGHNVQVTTYVKQLLLCFQRGCLWLDRPYPIDIKLIYSIMGLPKTRGDPTPYLRPN